MLKNVTPKSFFKTQVAVCKLLTHLGETGKLRRGSKSKAQVGVLGGVCDSIDMGWRRGLGAGSIDRWGWGIAKHTLRYVEWLIRWNNRLSSAASDGADGWRGELQIGRRRDGVGRGDSNAPLNRFYIRAFDRPHVLPCFYRAGLARRYQRDSSSLLRSLLMTTIIIRKSTFPLWVSLRRYGRSHSPRCRA